jgi:anti-sigma regulatory factor (Ser/Thr protein kinase)
VEGPDKLVATAAYQPEPMAAAAARRFVRDTLQSWVVTGGDADGHGLVDDAVLLTSELVTNAVVHAGTPVQVTCRLADDNVEVVVRDSQPASLVPEPPASDRGPTERTGGRGLLLPSALASAWGVTYGRTAKAVWFRIGLGGPGAGLADSLDGQADGSPAGPAALTAALRQALATPDRARSAAPAAAGLGMPGSAPAGSGYRDLLQHTVQAARSAVGADAACALLADEDGELRLRAAAGAVPAGPSPSVITVPFVVDGRVTGLLAATRAQPQSFRDSETARLQELADRAGPALERARLGEMDRIRRDRIGALAIARDLLAGDLEQDKAMALVGEAVVPRLAPWCAVLLPGPGQRLRTAYARHLDEAWSPALSWLLDRLGESATVPGQRLPRSGPRAAWRWPLAGDGASAGAGAGEAPEGAAALAGDAAWCFPFAGRSGTVGVLAAGCPDDERLPRDASALVADLAARLGLALASVPLSGPAR